MTHNEFWRNVDVVHSIPLSGSSLRLTPLRAIPNLPYAQNWTCNVLAVMAALSPVEPARMHPFTQRTAHLAEPSTAKRVHLTVFLDPAGFEPRVGGAVLLTGVNNHRFDGGSLKKYASDGGGAAGGRWWFEDPWEMRWCDIGGHQGVVSRDGGCAGGLSSVALV